MNTTPTDREGLAAFLMRIRARNIDARELMAAFEAVPRRMFIRPEFYDVAWSARTIPIDCGEVLEGADLQAQILRDLDVGSQDRVLEVGTGSGFTAAVISNLAKRVYTIERYRTLFMAAMQRLRDLKIDNVVCVHGDGAKISSDGPFDKIIVWAAFASLPRHYIEQLVSGGILVCAIGGEDEPQKLVRLTKVGSRFEREDLGSVRMQLLNSKIPEIL